MSVSKAFVERAAIGVGCLAVASLLSAQGTSDWTQWRGPNRDGSVPSFAAPADVAGGADLALERRRRASGTRRRLSSAIVSTCSRVRARTR